MIVQLNDEAANRLELHEVEVCDIHITDNGVKYDTVEGWVLGREDILPC